MQSLQFHFNGEDKEGGDGLGMFVGEVAENKLLFSRVSILLVLSKNCLIRCEGWSEGHRKIYDTLSF